MLFYNERKLLFSTAGHGFDKKIKEVSFFKNSVMKFVTKGSRWEAKNFFNLRLIASAVPTNSISGANIF